MTLTHFLTLLHAVTPKRTGWMARCPAHEDHTPSLSILEGTEQDIVLHCFAGCTVFDICQSLGLGIADLFSDVHDLHDRVRPAPRRSLRDLAFDYDLHGLDCERQAERIAEAAQACAGCETWTDEERELAMKAVHHGYELRKRAHWCYAYADHLRERAYELTSAARHEPPADRPS